MRRLPVAVSLAAFLCAAGVEPAIAATYFSQASASPTANSTWNSDRAGAGVLPDDFTSGDRFVIQGGHALTTIAAWNVTGASAAIHIETGGALTANHLVASPAFQVDDGATYLHNTASASANGASDDIPGSVARTLGAASTVEIRKWSSGGTTPVPLPDVTWGNLIINVASLGGNWTQGANLHTVKGNLTIQATGLSGRQFRLTGGGTATVDIAGNLSQSGGHVTCAGAAGTITVEVGGNLTLSGGLFSTAEAASLTGRIELAGDFRLIGGTLTENGNQAGTIVFNGNRVQSYTATSGVVIQTINWQVNSGTTLALGTNIVTGGGTFTLLSGGGLKIGAPAGITTSTSSGNIQTSGSRIFSPGAEYAFDGVAPQVTGAGLPAGVTRLTIDNPAGVTLTSNVAVNGALDLVSGTLAIGARNLTLNGPTSSGGGTLASDPTGTVLYDQAAAGQSVLAGDYGNLTFGNFDKVLAASGVIGIAATFSPGAGSGHSLTGSTIEFEGALPQSLPAAISTFANLRIRNPAGVSLGSNVTVSGNLDLVSGSVNTGSNVLIVAPGGTVTRTGGQVVGRLRKHIPTGPFVQNFEIGSASGYAPVVVKFDHVAVAGELTASTAEGEHPNIATSGIDSSRSVNRYWSVVPTGIDYDRYVITLGFSNADIDPGATPTDFAIRRYDSPVWSATIPGVIAATSTEARDLTSFSDFAVGELETHALSVAAGPNGAIAPDGAQVADGSSQRLDVVADPTYHVLDVKVDGVSIGPVASYTFENVHGPHTLEATFELTTYTILASAGANGTVSPAGAVTVVESGNPSFSIVADPHHHVLDVRVDGVSVGAVAEYTFMDVGADHSIEASFSIDQHTILAVADSGGSISPAGAVVVEHGGEQTFTFTPAPRHHVVNVTVDGESLGSVPSFTFADVSASHAIRVGFAIDSFVITAMAGPDGSISPAGSVGVSSGGSVGFDITPATGFRILDVRVDGVSVGVVNRHDFDDVQGDHTIEATFVAGLLAADESPTRLALAGLWPNPGTPRNLRVAFSLSGSEPARIELVDIAGRVIASEEVGRLGAGHHSVRIGRGVDLAAGVYLIRLRQGRHALRAKATVVR